MQPKHIVMILAAFLFTSFAAILFVRWINPPPVLPEEYKKEMQQYDNRLKLLIESHKEREKVVDLVDRVIKAYEQKESIYQNVIKRNDLQIKIIQKQYEKNNHYDTADKFELHQYVSEYK